MTIFADLRPRNCPVCGADATHAPLFLAQSINPAKLSGFSFASRKTPEYMSYRLVRCPTCSTVYAVAAPPAEALATAYAEADYDSTEEAILAADTYMAGLADVIGPLPRGGRALEIGTGTGILLERLLDSGFAEVVGIEPSTAAMDGASARVRPFIQEGIFRGADFPPASFDLICCFQTLEHVPDPREMAAACATLLKPGGILALVTHDYTAALNRALGKRSPIIDIEHLQLFCRPSLDHLLTASGLTTERIFRLKNRYPIRYWLRLTTLPAGLKRVIQRGLRAVRLDGWLIAFDVGNLLTIGRKP